MGNKGNRTISKYAGLQEWRGGRAGHAIVILMRAIVLVLSVVLVVMITDDTLHNVSFLGTHVYMKVQFWVCMFFLLDIVVEWILARDRRKYVGEHVLFIIISIPYLTIIQHLDLQLPGQIIYILRFIPMIRAAYVFGIVAGVATRSRMTSLFMSYIVILLTTVYVGSLLFFIEEHYVNTSVTDYWDAVYWAVMSLTTTGANISEITPTGKTIAVILSGEGLILFPVFTVYITNALGGDSTTS